MSNSRSPRAVRSMTIGISGMGSTLALAAPWPNVRGRAPDAVGSNELDDARTNASNVWRSHGPPPRPYPPCPEQAPRHRRDRLGGRARGSGPRLDRLRDDQPRRLAAGSAPGDGQG